MRIKYFTFLLLAGMIFSVSSSFAQGKKKTVFMENEKLPAKYQVDSRVDNMGYWRKMAMEGLVPVAPEAAVPAAIYRSSKIMNSKTIPEDSQDVPVTEVNSTQSENSIFINPNDNTHVLQSNNSTQNPVGSLYGANDFYTFDGGLSWLGEITGAGGGNSGDPTTAIGLNGRMYVGYIHSNGGQGVSYSDDNGSSWTPVLVQAGPGGSGLLDKNHMWIDNSPSSPYEGNLYNAWTNFGGSTDTEIEISRSTDDGVSWSSSVVISSGINAGSHNQGVNIQTGPNGEVYVIWTIYDSWPSDETAIGMARSLDGGVTWDTPRRIITNIRGIRTSETSKYMRVNSFPSMAVDISNGAGSGNIYITWTNIGVPGTNVGPDIDVYMARSSDGGENFDVPVKVNQDEAGLGKEHFFPWITSDPISGDLAVIFYDDRNVSSTQCEVFCAVSTDSGNLWEDFRVSDVAFTPQPIPGLASDYMGDYLGIAARDRLVYPVWTDNRLGVTMTFCSPFVLGPPPNQPWVIYQDVVVNDAATNNNGQLDFNESVDLDVSMKNIGDMAGNNINVTLSTENEYVTIDDDMENFGDFALEELKTLASAFSITTADNIPDGEVIDFVLTASDSNDSIFISGFRLEAFAPALALENMVVNDPAGNNNGRLDAGETAELQFAVTNPGSFELQDVMASLLTTSPFITLVNDEVEVGLLESGAESMVTFAVEVDENTPIGTSVEFVLHSAGGNYSAEKAYFHVVGLVLEDWESGDFTNFSWEMSGDAGWILDEAEVYEGMYASKSDDIDDSESAIMSLSYNVMHNDSISFYYKVSSEANYDYLKFYIDNSLVGQWAGEVSWSKAVYPVLEGEHTFKWEYNKDVGVSDGDDCAWIDYIVLPPELATSAYAGADMATCGTSPVMMENANATYYNTVMWTTTGSGTFDDAEIVNPVYTPSDEDFVAGVVTLTITAYGESTDATDEVVITMNPAIEASMPESANMCSNVSYELELMAENQQAQMWSTSGDGYFDDQSVVNAVYTPGEADINDGSVMLSVTLTANDGCEDVMLEQQVTIFETPTSMLSGDAVVCLGDSSMVTIDFTGTAPWTIATGDGLDTYTIETTPWTHYVFPVETTVYDLLSLVDANGCESVPQGTATVTVNPLPVVMLGNDTSICHNHILTLDAGTDGVTFNWSTGETTQTISIDTTGVGIGGVKVIEVEVTNEFGCIVEDQIQVTFNDCTGIEDFAKAIDLQFYPNPTKGLLTVSFNAPQQDLYTLEVRDSQNRIVAVKNAGAVSGFATYTMDLSNVAEGVYLLNIENSTHSYSQKIVVKH